MASDWGGTGWAEDTSKAITQAGTWVDSVATARGWAPSHATALRTAIATSGKGATSSLDFWKKLLSAAQSYRAILGDAATPAGLDKLIGTFASAAGTTVTTAAAREEGSAAAIAAGTLDASIGDVEDLAAAAGDAVRVFKHPAAWIAAAFVGIWLWKGDK